MRSLAAYRWAVAVALLGALLLVWLSLGVGIIGKDGDPANRMYFGVLAVGIIGALIGRFRPGGMARALLAAALAQAVVAAIALIARLGLPYSPPAEIVLLNGFFVAMFLGSAWLFRRAAGVADRALVRPEREGDHAAVHALNARAFESAAEADLVDVLRERARPVVSLVAEHAGRIIGHVLFSPVSLDGHAELNVAGLAPMAVAPEHQRRGVGSALVRAGLEQCKQAGFGAVVVLGHPRYYPRFGFVPATRFGIRCEYDAPDDAFMALELDAGCLRGRSGTIRYHAAFAAL